MSQATATEPQQPAPPLRKVDWSSMQALFVKGCSYKELSQRYGINEATIRSRAHRNKWPQTVAEAATLVKQGAIHDLSDSVRSWVSKIDKFTHSALDSLLTRNPKDMKVREIQELAQAAKTLAEVYRPNAGLDKGATGAAHVALLVNVNGRAATTTTANCDDPIIDVEQLPPRQLE